MTAHRLTHWKDAIPPQDIARFSDGETALHRAPTFGERPALIIVDMTRAFVDDAYPTGCSEAGEPAVRSIARLLAAAREQDLPVVFTKCFADPEYRPVRRQTGRWKMDVAQPTDPMLPSGDVIVDELAPRPGEIVIHKQLKPSAFFGTTLAADLIAESVDTVIVTGMTTSGCVRATAVDAFQFNFNVTLVEEACGDRSHISHCVTLFDLHMKYADVVTEHDAHRFLSSVRPAVATAAVR
jgi:nicotinamidase-related amidase